MDLCQKEEHTMELAVCKDRNPGARGLSRVLISGQEEEAKTYPGVRAGFKLCARSSLGVRASRWGGIDEQVQEIHRKENPNNSKN